MRRIIPILLIVWLLAGCMGEMPDGTGDNLAQTSAPTPTVTLAPPPLPFATRPAYPPGELVDYTAQSGDLLPALAARFNTTVEEIRKANPIIPDGATTMPPGMPMRIPIHYRALWGNPYQIIPDGLFVEGPAEVGFDAVAFVNNQPGWLKNYSTTAGGTELGGGALVAFVAREYSVSPRLLLALSEYLSGALSNPQMPGNPYLLGKVDTSKEGYYRQLAWLADTLNGGYYAWRLGDLLEFTLRNGRLERPDPWQNAATVAIQSYFAAYFSPEAYASAIAEGGVAATWRALFGDPWASPSAQHIPGSLVQPEMQLPFEVGKTWAYTGGPHSAWGEEMAPPAAIDFAPPSTQGGCTPSDEWVTAVADGVVARTGPGILVLDLDGDGDERTGWVMFYLHLKIGSTPAQGTRLQAGERVGHPSCDGGQSTGTHVHLSRKFNGEWMPAYGLLGYSLDGWTVTRGLEAYQGGMQRGGRTINACTCSDSGSFIAR